MSDIQWTDKTWNPLAGCTAVSPGCLNCYAAGMALRLEGMAKADIAKGRNPGGKRKYIGVAERKNGRAVFNGTVNMDEDALSIPLKRKTPTTWFVNSESDLFHEAVPFDFIDKVFAVMALTPQHTYQVLTKRPERMAEYMRYAVKFDNLTEEMDRSRFKAKGEWEWSPVRPDEGVGWPLPSVWLGTSPCNQRTADESIPPLLECPTVVRFLSCEPLLGPIDVASWGWRNTLRSHPRVDWVIVGGESGHNARPCDVAWIRDIVRQCREAGVPVFVKQLGAKPYQSPDRDGATGYMLPINDPKGGDPAEWPEDLRVREMPVVAEATP